MTLATGARERKIKWLLKQHKRACFWCGNHLSINTATLDHFIPRQRGGSAHRSNMVPACQPCNSAKGHRLPTEGDLERLGRWPFYGFTPSFIPTLPKGDTCVDWLGETT